MGDRATTLAQHGQYSKALRALESNMGIAKIDGTTIEKLRALHPHERGYKGIAFDEEYFNTLNAIATTNPITIDESELCKAVAQMDFKSAGGPSGLRGYCQRHGHHHARATQPFSSAPSLAPITPPSSRPSLATAA